MTIAEAYITLIKASHTLIKESDRTIVDKAFEFCLSSSGCSENDDFDDSQTIETIMAIAEIAVNEIHLAGKALCSIFLYKWDIDAKTIQEEYHPKVAQIIEGLRRLQRIDKKNSAYNQENFIKLTLTQADDVRAILIDLAEKMHATRQIAALPHEKQQQICKEISSLYAPIAHRLGLYNIKTEMEEIALKYLHNDTYKTIARKLAETKSSREAYIKRFIEPIDEKLKETGLKYTIKGRPKSIHSIWNKIKNNKVQFEQVYDLFAIRIIVDSESESREKPDCWNVYSIVSDIYRPNPQRLRDWISAPKSSGYESLHTTVIGPEGKWVEVQIRTNRMDEIAEKGPAAHWKYKEGKNAVGSTSWLANIRETLEAKNADAFEKEHTAKIDLYSDEIFIFTPTGDLRRLRANSTVLDFAYEIHTKVGSSCIGGKVNGKIMPIKHILQNGDKVEILTSKTQSPKQDWLSFVQSSKARQRIKKHIKETENKQNEEGKEILIRKLNQIKVKFDDHSVFKLVKHYKLKDSYELYRLILNEKFDFSELKSVFSEEKPALNKPEQIDSKKISKKFSADESKNENVLVIDKTLDNIEYKLSPCCNPIKGDDIFGFVSATQGIKIHRVNCPNAAEMLNKFPYRIISAKWKSEKADSQFLAGIRVTGTDEIGIINTITELISRDLRINMRNLNVESNDGVFEGKIIVFVQDIQHLDSLLKKIRTLKGVHSATRFDAVK